jgi:cytochrome c biogenesis protein CcmG, thiol:disulfide interchange protein DsbE
LEKEIWRKYRDRGVVVLGIDAREHAPLAEQTEKARQFRGKHGLTYPILVDAGDQVVEQYRVFGFPTNVIIDRQGIVHEVVPGADPTVPQKIAALLSRP